MLISVVTKVIYVHLKEAVEYACFSCISTFNWLNAPESVYLKCIYMCWSLDIYLPVYMNEQHLTPPISNCHGLTAEKHPHTLSFCSVWFLCLFPYGWHTWSNSWCTVQHLAVHCVLQVIVCEETNVHHGNWPFIKWWGENALSLLSRKLNSVWGGNTTRLGKQ